MNVSEIFAVSLAKFGLRMGQQNGASVAKDISMSGPLYVSKNITNKFSFRLRLLWTTLLTLQLHNFSARCFKTKHRAVNNWSNDRLSDVFWMKSFIAKTSIECFLFWGFSVYHISFRTSVRYSLPSILINGSQWQYRILALLDVAGNCFNSRNVLTLRITFYVTCLSTRCLFANVLAHIQ